MAASDREVVEALLASGWTPDAPNQGAPEVGLTGGDLHRTVGSPAHSVSDLRSGRAMRLPVDLGVVELTAGTGPSTTTRSHPFCAHLLVGPGATSRTLFWRHTLLAMNAAFLRGANLAPAAHPDDGRLELTEGRLGPTDALRARRRTATGTHVPHPALRQSRVRDAERSFERPVRVVVDGTAVGSATAIRIRCVPDAVVIVV